MKTIALTFAALFASTVAHADIMVRFGEGAPKDRFTIENTGTCAVTAAQVTIDLSTSKAGLVFDVTEEGAGVEVFQPFEFTAGAKLVARTPVVKDGDNVIDLSIDSLTSTQNVAFTIDVDDTMGGREITVNGSEIEGAEVRMRVNGQTSSAVFGNDARAILAGC